MKNDSDSESDDPTMNNSYLLLDNCILLILQKNIMNNIKYDKQTKKSYN